METKSLELFYSDGGYPGKKITKGENMEMGSYDISKGKEFEFFIRNPLHNALIDISDLHLDADSNITLDKPDEIMPFETVKATIKIKKKEIEEFDVMTADGLESFNDMMKEMQEEMKRPSEIIGKLHGKITTLDINVIRDDKQTRYGW